MKRFNIRTLEKMSGIKPSTIRIWELRYGLLRPERRPGGQRLYTIDEARLLMEVAHLCRQGNRISSLATLDEAGRAQRLDGLTDTDAQLETLRIRLTDCLYRFDTPAFEQLLEQGGQRFGSKVLQQLLLELLERAGILSARQPDAAERWALLRVRQWLYARLEATPVRAGADTVLLFAPLGGPEELLLSLACHWRAQGFDTIWLGSGVSLVTLEELLRYRQPAILCTTHPVAGLTDLASRAGVRLLTLEENARRQPSLDRVAIVAAAASEVKAA